ncbi:uncharacterized protein LOC143021288 [Oratosquilla oratoria]|uniref:uncharacterized protein LOC143021288 n=1 Tax=Oratosquilla oratoria TaxID=337810 RepID=UPI003F7611FB
MKVFHQLLILSTWMAWEAHAAYVPDLIPITCTPETDGRQISCVCDQPTSATPPVNYLAFDVDEPAVTCGVELMPSDAHLPNFCLPLLGKQNFVQCTARVPESMLTMTFPKMIGSEAYPYMGDEKLPEPSEHCQNECDKWDQEKGCLVDKECRLCLREFNILYPEVEMEKNYCY